MDSIRIQMRVLCLVTVVLFATLFFTLTSSNPKFQTSSETKSSSVILDESSTTTVIATIPPPGQPPGISDIMLREDVTTTNWHLVDEEGEEINAAEYSLLPDKVFTVIGLESSGTTFMAHTLRNALGLRIVNDPSQYEAIAEGFSNRYNNLGIIEEEDKSKNKLYWTEVQHLSLPWGGNDCRLDPRQNMVEVIYPGICSKLMRDVMTFNKPKQFKSGPFVSQQSLSFSRTVMMRYKIPKKFWNTTLKRCEDMVKHNGSYTYPKRYSLNLTSHLDWYHSRGIDAKAIIIMRDATISRRARKGHCKNSTLLALEEELGREILQEAIRKHMLSEPPPLRSTGGQHPSSKKLVQSSSEGRVVLVSYELMNQLKGVYVKLLFNELGINTTYEPLFKDGNIKHVRDEPCKEGLMGKIRCND